MTTSRANRWQRLMELSPLCSGSLHEQYLTCGKAECRCHDRRDAQRHGPYYLWIRRIGGKQVNRTLRPGPDLERVRQGIANYQKLQQLLGEVVEQSGNHGPMLLIKRTPQPGRPRRRFLH